MCELTDYSSIIEKEFGDIIKGLTGTKIYGKEIDLTNYKELIVGSFYLGSIAELDRQARTREKLRELEIKWSKNSR